MPNPSRPSKAKTPTVLIVDDSEMNRAILNEMLKDEYCILEDR